MQWNPWVPVRSRYLKRDLQQNNLTCTVKLPEFAHSHLVVLHVANEYNFKSHDLQAFMNFIDSSPFLVLPKMEE